MIFLWSTYTVFHSNVNAFNFTQWIERSSKCTRTNKDWNGFLYIVLKDEDKQTIISRAVCSFALKKGSVPDPDLELRGGWPGFFEILKQNWFANIACPAGLVLLSTFFHYFIIFFAKIRQGRRPPGPSPRSTSGANSQNVSFVIPSWRKNLLDTKF